MGVNRREMIFQQLIQTGKLSRQVSMLGRSHPFGRVRGNPFNDSTITRRDGHVFMDELEAWDEIWEET